MPCNHLILCHPSIRVFNNESALHVRWPKYWNSSPRDQTIFNHAAEVKVSKYFTSLAHTLRQWTFLKSSQMFCFWILIVYHYQWSCLITVYLLISVLWIVLKDRPQYSMLSDFHPHACIDSQMGFCLNWTSRIGGSDATIVLDLSLKKVWS